MSFCSKCGNEISESVQFCPNCGQPVNNVINVNNQKNVENSGISPKEEMAKVYDYFSKKQDLYQNYDQLCNTINNIPNKIKYLNIVPAVIIIAIGCFLGTKFKENEIIHKIISVLMTVLLFLDAIYIFYYKFIKSRKFIAERDRINSEIVSYYNAYGNCPIGVEFTRLQDIQKIIEMLNSGRAKNIPDAINLVLDDEHKSRVERNAFIAAQNAAQAAKSAKSAERASWLNYLSKK